MTQNFAIYPSLNGKTVFVSGGAQGIGAEIVRAFAAQGLHPSALPLGVDIDAWLARAPTTWDAFPDSTGAKSDADYLVAGRSLGPFAVGMSLFATWFASESLIATSGEVARDGIAGARAEPFAYAIGILAIALFFAHRLRSGGFITIADFLRSRFGPGTESLAAVVIALSATTWSAAQLFAFATIIASASGLDFTTGLIGATLLVMTYTLFGGLAGDVVTDIVQGIIIVIAILILFALMASAFGGPAAMWAAAPPTVWSFTAPGESWIDRIELWLIPIAGTMVSQEAIARTLAARSPNVARKGALAGGAPVAEAVRAIFRAAPKPSTLGSVQQPAIDCSARGWGRFSTLPVPWIRPNSRRWRSTREKVSGAMPNCAAIRRLRWCSVTCMVPLWSGWAWLSNHCAQRDSASCARRLTASSDCWR